MTSKYFSASTLGFYDSQDSESIPEDAVEISASFYQQLLLGESQGKVISSAGGSPILVDRVEVDNTQTTEKLWIEVELIRVRDELEKVQDSDPKAVGSVATWREYRKALRAYAESNSVAPNTANRPVLSL